MSSRSVRSVSYRSRVAMVVTVVALPLGLTGCGGARDAGKPGVASLPSAAASRPAAGTAATTAAGGASASGGVPGERPLIRWDTSREETDRLMAIWTQCMFDHGADRYPSGKPKAPDDSPATLACLPVQPENYLDRLARTDPHYKDYVREWINCVRARGIKVTPNETRFVFDDRSQIDSGEAFRVSDECEASTFNGKI